MSMRNPLPVRPPIRHFGLTSGQWHFLGGWAAIVGCALLVLTVLAWIIGVGSTSCPATNASNATASAAAASNS